MLPLGIGHKSLQFHNASLIQAVTNNSWIGLHQNSRKYIQNVFFLMYTHFNMLYCIHHCRKPAILKHHLREAI